MIRIKQIEWKPLINQYMLIKKTDGKWIFGEVTSYDPLANILVITALDEYDFHSLRLSVGATIAEAWVVKQWSSYTMPTGNTAQRPHANTVTPTDAAASPAGRWLLFKDDIDCWTFGKVDSYNPEKNTIKIKSVISNEFGNEDKHTNPVVEAWAVEKWAKLYPEGGTEAEPAP